MPIFECEQCHAAENTALGEFWGREKKLCSECATGKWHGEFEKKSAIGMLIDNHGGLWSKEEVDSGRLPKHFKVVGRVEDKP